LIDACRPWERLSTFPHATEAGPELNERSLKDGGAFFQKRQTSARRSRGGPVDYAAACCHCDVRCASWLVRHQCDGPAAFPAARSRGAPPVQFFAVGCRLIIDCLHFRNGSSRTADKLSALAFFTEDGLTGRCRPLLGVYDFDRDGFRVLRHVDLSCRHTMRR